MDPKAVEHIKEVIHDKNRVWGQLVEQCALVTGLPAEQLVTLAAGLVALYLTFGDQARLLANCILIGVPLFVYLLAPQEKPRHELVMIYCACYAFSTTLDLSLEASIPAYYLLKLAFHIALFLRPYCLAEQLLALTDLKTKSQERGAKEKEEASSSEAHPQHKLFSKEELSKLLDRKAKSPPPEKPEGEKPKPTVTVLSPWPQSSEMRSIVVHSPPEHVRTACSPSVHHRVSDKPAGFHPASGGNEMHESPSTYLLESSASDTSTAGGEGSHDPVPRPEGADSPNDGPGVGAYDVEWLPKNRIVFNAPFDYAHLTYHIRMKNVSRYPLGYAIKSNAIPRVTASPPTGIIRPGKSAYIAVTVQKMEVFEEEVLLKDRIAIEYVRVPEDTAKFEFKLIQFSNVKLRKNIYIKYNP